MALVADVIARQAANSKPCFSLEFFPPKSADAENTLYSETIPPLLKDRQINFCSVTYGAGGIGVSDNTIKVVDGIQKRFNLPTVMHITRIGATRSKLKGVMDDLKEKGIQNLLALGGDAPPGCVPQKGDFKYASDLINFFKNQDGKLSIGVAGYPEGNNAYNESTYSNWRYLVEKIRLGVDFVITQLFFDNSNFLRFRDFVHRELGYPIPILAGVLPVTSCKQALRFTDLTGSVIPRNLRDALEKYHGDDASMRQFGVDYCLEQSRELLKEGVSGIHFYCLNRSSATLKVLGDLIPRSPGSPYPTP